MTSELLPWLRVQIEADVRAASIAAGPIGFDWKWNDAGRTVGSPRDGDPIAQVGDRQCGQHIALHDPARVLAEAEAKLRIAEMHQPKPVMGPLGMGYACAGCAEPVGPSSPCTTLRLLALPYADRTGYQGGWGLLCPACGLIVQPVPGVASVHDCEVTPA